MLQKIHDKVSGWVAYFLLGILAIVFVFWGIDFGFSAARYAAKVKADGQPWWEPAQKIGVEQVRQAWQNQITQFQQLYRGEVPDELEASLQRRLLEEFVRQELLTQHTESLGYRVSDADILRAYESIPAFQVDGKFSRDIAQYRLQIQGMTPAVFEAEQRRYLQTAQLEQALAQSAFVTPAELAHHGRLQGEQREASWLIVPAARFLAGIQPDAEQIEAYYNEHQERYMTPETVALRHIELKLENLAAATPVAEEDLRAHYEGAKERYVNEAGEPQTFEQARAQIESELRAREAERRFGELQEQLADKAFENLNDLDGVARELGLPVQEVATFRRDTGGGALGAQPEVIEAAFSGPVLNGENSRPIELAPGHLVVLRVSAHKPAEPRPLAEVRESVVQALKEAQSREQARALARRSAALMQAGTENLERLATELKTQPQGPRFIGRTETDMPIELRNALFTLPRPESGQALYRAVALGNGDAAILKFSGASSERTEESVAQREARERLLREQLGRSEVDAYIAELRRNASVTINPKVFE